MLFTVIGFTHDVSGAAQISDYTEALGNTFNISPWLMVVPLLTGVMIARKMPAIIVLGLSSLLASIAAVIFQPEIVTNIGSSITEGPLWKVQYTGIVETIYNSVSVETGNPEVDKLVASRGMTGMLNTVYLIICAMCFGGCMKASGMLHHLASLLLPFTKRRTSLVTSTVLSGVALNGIVSDQYLAIILTSNIFKDVYDREGYDPRLLSRSVEDSATITSPLFPWSSCGMTQATILSVPTLTYLPFCFFNYISPLMSILIAATGYKILRRKDVSS